VKAIDASPLGGGLRTRDGSRFKHRATARRRRDSRIRSTPGSGLRRALRADLACPVRTSPKLADAHCQASIGAGLLARLVDRSLVVVEDSSARVRYRLLETIAEYATERLAAAAE
jgi:hypothetical protein